MSFDIQVTEFNGIRNDMDKKFIGQDYFYECQNMTFDNIVGADKMTVPTTYYDFNDATNDIDGLFKFVYVNANNEYVTEYIAVTGGKIYTGWDTDSPTEIYDGLEVGAKCSFVIQNDRLVIANGVNYQLIYDGTYVWEMGAPRAENQPLTVGNLNGVYYYAMTVTIGGVEIRFGTISNTVTAVNNQVILDVPTGHADITARTIYRTEAGGTILKKVATIADNTTTSYTDNIADGSLTTVITTATLSEMPIVKYLTRQFDQIIGCVNPKKPSSLYISTVNKEFFLNTRGEYFISNNGRDNTPIVGMSLDYDRVVVFSEKQVYTVDASSTIATTSESRANVGCLNGDSIVRVPDNQYSDANGNVRSFPGGVMFVSSIGDIRVFNGNFAQPISTSLDNLKTENWAQSIRGSLAKVLSKNTNMSAEFFDYKYHLLIDYQLFLFDIRGGKWSIMKLQTATYTPLYNYLYSDGEYLYAGRKNTAIIEQFYDSKMYSGEEFEAYIESPQLMASEDYKYFRELYMYYDNSGDVTVNVKVSYDGDVDNGDTFNMVIDGGYFSSTFFSNNNYDVSNNDTDYAVIYLNRMARWVEFSLSCSDGMFGFRGYRLTGDDLSNKET